MKTSMLAVLGKDRPGIIAKVTGILFQEKANLEDISMTVLEGQFAMMLVLSYPPAKFGKISQKIEKTAKASELSVYWKELPKLRYASEDLNQNLYLVTAIGRDRTGIVAQISRVLAASGLNIQDLNSKIIGQGKNRLYAMALEVALPAKASPEALGKKLSAAGLKLKMDITLKPIERLEF